MRNLYFALPGMLLVLCFQAAGANTHIIQKGDTLYSLSRTYDVSVNEIREANPGLDVKSLQVGDKIKIPVKQEAGAVLGSKNGTAVPEFYAVRKGDTLSSISRQTGVDAAEIQRLNRLDGGRIRIGQKLRLRSAEAAKKSSGTPAETPEPHYLFVSRVKDKIDAPKIGSRTWRYIVVHHSGTSSGSAKIFEYYHRYVRGMENGMAYHFVIGNGTDTGDGEIEVGNRWLKQLQGGHLRSDEQNEVAIGICLVGNFNTTRPTRKQIAALIELITYLDAKIYKAEHIKPKFVLHRDINIRPTDCPGKNFPAQAMYRLFGAWTGL